MSRPKIDPLEYIRNYYKVPAYAGAPIEYQGKAGVITGAYGSHVMARLVGERHARPYHPNDLTYSPSNKAEGKT